MTDICVQPRSIHFWATEVRLGNAWVGCPRRNFPSSFPRWSAKISAPQSAMNSSSTTDITPTITMNKGLDRNSKIYVAGHTGLAGSALLRRLAAAGYQNLLTRTHRELDLIDQGTVQRFFQQERPEYVFLAAAKVGGIHANRTYPADFLYQNLAIATNVIHASYSHGVRKLLFLGSSCIY